MKFINITCFRCSKEFSKLFYEYNRRLKEGFSNFFCSSECNTKNAKEHQQKCKLKRHELFSKICLNCSSQIPFNKKNNRFCGGKCAATFNQRDGGHRKWTEDEKKKHRELLKNNHYFNGDRKRAELITLKCLNCPIQFSIPKYNKKKCCSHKCSGEYIKKTGRLKGKSGGFRLKGGRAKTGWYKGVFCGSTYELAWVIKALDQKIVFERNLKGFPYINSDGESRKYYPDFYIPFEDCYVEIKGFREKEFENKQKSFPHRIKVVEKNEIESIVLDAKNKFNTKKLQDLYEKC